MKGIFDPYPDIRRHYDVYAKDGTGNSFLRRLPGGESRYDALVRNDAGLRKVIEDYPRRFIVLTSHQGGVTAQLTALQRLETTEAGVLKPTGIPKTTPYVASAGGRWAHLPLSRPERSHSARLGITE